MASIDNVTVDDFKNLFTRDFPYLPLYVDGKIYFKGDEVYFNEYFYTSLIDGNNTNPTNTSNWELTNDSVNNYIQDTDIERAFLEAKLNFNPAFWTDDKTAIMVYLYLVAHYLVIDLNNASNPLGMGFMGFTQSKSVGSVSTSYMLPSWIQNDRILGQFMQTGYGAKYISLISPYLIGNIFVIKGATTYE